MYFCKVADENEKKLLLHGCFHNLATFQKWFPCENKGRKTTTRNWSRSGILTLLTLLSADAKSPVLLRVSSLTKVWSTQFSVATICKWLCLVHQQLAMRLWHVKSFILSTSFSVTEIPPWRVSAKCQLLCLYSQFSLTKILKAIQVLIFTAFWGNVSRPS